MRLRRAQLSVLCIAVLGLLPISHASGAPAVDQAPKDCRLMISGDAPPVGIGGCPGVRPGAFVSTPVGGCTLNFLFSGSDGRRYIGTAGHCILGGEGEQTWASGTGPVARDGAGSRIGTFAYAALGGVRDFSLIRLDAGVPASAQMCHFGGPTAIDRSLTTTPTVLHHRGNGLALGSVLPARSAVAATGLPDADTAEAVGLAIFGDSGSGIITDEGKAVGVVVTVGAHAGVVNGTPVVGDIGITRLGPQLDRAASRLGISLTLQTAPLL